jgi:hypothetical protein
LYWRSVTEQLLQSYNQLPRIDLSGAEPGDAVVVRIAKTAKGQLGSAFPPLCLRHSDRIRIVGRRPLADGLSHTSIVVIFPPGRHAIFAGTGRGGMGRRRPSGSGNRPPSTPAKDLVGQSSASNGSDSPEPAVEERAHSAAK